jgi:MFS transporter, ACS family, solute carrier family 17 (sodium-dependent inorganic phosphate cotransporter), other
MDYDSSGSVRSPSKPLLSLPVNDSPRLEPQSKSKKIGFRYYGFATLGFCGLAVAYLLRVNLSVAVVAMARDFEWDDGDSTRGIVLSSFFYGYLVNQLPGGWLATRFGGKWVLLASLGGTSLFTLLLPLAAVWGLGPLVACRVATGLCEAMSYPAIHALLTHWSPLQERSRLGTFIWAGAYVGTIVGLGVSPSIIDAWGWPMLFYSSGAVGVVWALAWAVFGSSTPGESRFVSRAEKELLARAEREQALVSTSTTTAVRPPWRKIFGSPAFWAIAVNHFAYTWFLYIALTWLPSFMDSHLHMSLTDSGLASFLPFAALFGVTLAGGFIADSLIKRNVRVVTVRKLMQVVGNLVPAACLVLLAFWSSVPSVGAVALLTVFGSAGLCMSGFHVNHIDISPKYAGVLMGLTNTGATVPGVVGVLLTGWILDATGSWALVFLIAAGIDVTAVVVMVCCAKGTVCIE